MNGRDKRKRAKAKKERSTKRKTFAGVNFVDSLRGVDHSEAAQPTRHRRGRGDEGPYVEESH